jgi:hypothetical protein
MTSAQFKAFQELILETSGPNTARRHASGRRRLPACTLQYKESDHDAA